ncbi:MAG: hypothetical protein QW597_00625 [Thermoplasmataceae archaeon]
MSLIFLVPIVLLISTVVVYILLGPSLRTYLEKTEEKTDRIQKLSTLIIAYDIVTFFSNSESSKVVEGLLKMAREDDKTLYGFLDNTMLSARDEINRLHDKLKMRDEQTSNQSKIRMSAVFIRTITIIAIIKKIAAAKASINLIAFFSGNLCFKASEQ